MLTPSLKERLALIESISSSDMARISMSPLASMCEPMSAKASVRFSMSPPSSPPAPPRTSVADSAPAMPSISVSSQANRETPWPRAVDALAPLTSAWLPINALVVLSTRWPVTDPATPTSPAAAPPSASESNSSWLIAWIASPARLTVVRSPLAFRSPVSTLSGCPDPSAATRVAPPAGSASMKASVVF